MGPSLAALYKEDRPQVSPTLAEFPLNPNFQPVARMPVYCQALVGWLDNGIYWQCGLGRRRGGEWSPTA